MPPGTYYLEFYGIGDDASWQYPYAFRLEWSESLPTTVEAIEDKVEIKVYPNPTPRYASIEMDNQQSLRGYITLQNNTGQTVYQEAIEGRQIRQQIDLGGLPDGVYFVALSTENEVETIKLIKGRR